MYNFTENKRCYFLCISQLYLKYKCSRGCYWSCIMVMDLTTTNGGMDLAVTNGAGL